MEVKSYILTNRALRHPNSTVSLIPNYGSSLQMGSSSYETIVFKSAKNLELDYLVKLQLRQIGIHIFLYLHH